jgi:hypothetical protein
MRAPPAAATLLLLATALGCDGGAAGRLDAGAPCQPPAAPVGSWDHAGLLNRGRCDARVVWTGEEVLVRSGFYCEATDEAYNPATGATRLLAAAGAPPCGHDETAVWTGSEMIVWGQANDGSGSPVAARYEPATDTWRPVSLEGAPLSAQAHSAVWTGSEMIVFGGWTNLPSGELVLDIGGAYDPATDGWRLLPRAGAPSRRRNHSAVWTDGEMLIWGGLQEGSNQLADGAAYDPLRNTWRPIAAGGPRLARPHALVWTGTAVLAFGDRISGYDPSADVWYDVCAHPDLTPSGGTAIWTGSAVALINGPPASFLWDSGALFDPATGIWTPLTIHEESLRGSAVWTGSQVVMVGGCLNSCFDCSPVIDALTL